MLQADAMTHLQRLVADADNAPFATCTMFKVSIVTA